MKSLIFILAPFIIATALSSCTLNSNNDINSLNAFKTINVSITRSNDMIDDRNIKMIKLIYAEKKIQPEKVTELIKIIKQVNQKSIEVSRYINDLVSELSKSENDGDLSVVSKLLTNGKDGDTFKVKLESYKSDIKGLMLKYPLPANIPLDLTLPITGNEKNVSSWQGAYFYNTPKIAAITILNKFNNDVKNTEAMCIDRLAKEAVSTDINLDRFKPLVSTKSYYVHSGDKYEALVGLGAFSSVVDNQIFIGGQKMEVKDGQALYTVKTNSLGTFKVPILIKLVERSGSYWEIPGELEYKVGK